MGPGTRVGAGRSTAIVLFTDLVGSTELRSRLGENAAEELRHKHDALVADAVQAHRGQQVKNLGDGIMATFRGASHAVGAAVAIQQAIGRHNRSGATPLQVRIGISAGDVVLEEEDCFGTPVIEAARLCAVATGGQILASETVRALARFNEVTFTPLGRVELKGLPDPVSAVEVGWELLPQSSVPLPAFLTDIGRIFVGRDGELDRLGQLWEEATAGELRVVLVAGEPGVGKTRLAAELARRVHDEGAMVLAGRCDEDLGVPYQPFVEALRHFVDHGELLAGRLGRYGGELARLVPEVGGRVPALQSPLRSDPETERYWLFDAVASWLVAASTDEPVLLVLDDLHWAAKPTLMLLRHVLRARGGRVLVLGTYRDSELAHDHPLVDAVADLRRQGVGERMSLTGLDDVAVRSLVEAASGQTLDEAGLVLAQAIHEETEGNPFFVREVLQHLAETGGLRRREGVWTNQLPVEQLGIPEGVRDAVGHRLSRLSGEAKQALRVAAVVGPEFELGVVRVAGDLSEEAVLGAVEEAADARLLTEVSATRFRFAHAIVRATLYESLTAARKVALHRKAAEAIETVHTDALDDYLPALAHHWAKASAPATDVSRAVEYARRAGDRALTQLAHDEAANYYASGLELLEAAGADPADPRRLELLLGRGEAQRRAGHPGHRQTLLDAAQVARQVGDAHALARAALANSRGYIYSAAFQVDDARVEVLERALAAIGEDDAALRARLLANLGMELAWQPDPGRRFALSDEALRIATSLGDQGVLAHVLLVRDYTINGPDNPGDRFTATTRLLEAADRLGDPVLTSRALILRFKAAMELADVAEAQRCLARNQQLVGDLGQRILTWGVLHQRASLSVLHTDPDAEATVLAARDFCTTLGQPDLVLFATAPLYVLYLHQGRLGELDDTIHQFADRTHSPLVQALYATLLGETGQRPAAAAIFDRFDANGFAHPTSNVAWLMFITQCAWQCARLGRAGCVPRLRSALEPYADQLVVAGLAGAVGGSVAYYLGLLATAATTGRRPRPTSPRRRPSTSASKRPAGSPAPASSGPA
ncbi:MAG TPA: AAA family ATPase [Pseudonocardiaceae bacterium]